MSIFTITAEHHAIDGDDVIRVRADAHRQHSPYETTLVGVSASGARRLAKFIAAHDGWRITVDAGPYQPALAWYEVRPAA